LKEVVIMTDNKDLKYVQQFNNQPYIPETRTEYVLNEEQPQQGQGEQKSTTEKVVETVAPVVATAKEELLPTVHASDDKNKENDGRGSPKIVQAEPPKPPINYDPEQPTCIIQ
jgi:hypothetical protein